MIELSKELVKIIKKAAKIGDVFISVENQTISIRAFNTDCIFEHRDEIETDKELSEHYTLDTQALQIVSMCNESIILEKNDTQISIKSGNYSAVVQEPVVKETELQDDNMNGLLKLDISLVNTVKYAVYNSDDKPVLKGIDFILDMNKQECLITALDVNRIDKNVIPFEIINKDKLPDTVEFVIDKKTLEKLLSITDEQPVFMKIGDKYIYFISNNNVMALKKVSLEYVKIDIAQFIGDIKINCKINKSRLITAINRCTINSLTGCIRIKGISRQKKVEISYYDANQASIKIKDDIDALEIDADFNILCKASYLKEALNSLEEDTVTFQFAENAAGIYFVEGKLSALILRIAEKATEPKVEKKDETK